MADSFILQWAIVFDSARGGLMGHTPLLQHRSPSLSSLLFSPKSLSLQGSCEQSRSLTLLFSSQCKVSLQVVCSHMQMKNKCRHKGVRLKAEKSRCWTVSIEEWKRSCLSAAAGRRRHLDGAHALASRQDTGGGLSNEPDCICGLGGARRTCMETSRTWGEHANPRLTYPAGLGPAAPRLVDHQLRRAPRTEYGTLWNHSLDGSLLYLSHKIPFRIFMQLPLFKVICINKPANLHLPLKHEHYARL